MIGTDFNYLKIIVTGDYKNIIGTDCNYINIIGTDCNYIKIRTWTRYPKLGYHTQLFSCRLQNSGISS